ncbi:VanZ family protein [Microbacterium sp. W1N]|uniref:VanZ family protein n=1 Tax=Microbacterium festucae TaxID=2977531 RepID=UPI0021C23F96|nr:VanZ family protein [Microbacterium festucae]MCT9819027.1 VanZ family protein [Microbacterium festucae]
MRAPGVHSRPQPRRRGATLSFQETPIAATPRSPARTLARDPRAWLALYLGALALIALWPTPVDQGAGPLLQAIARVAPALTYERVEFAANIALFVPFGLLLALIMRSRRWLALPIAVATTVLVELAQGLLPQRTPSVFDVIANTAGACLGIVVATVLDSRRRRQAQTPVADAENFSLPEPPRPQEATTPTPHAVTQ